MTVREALEQGYERFDSALQRGYVSVKDDPMEATVGEAGGYRKGLLYYLAHNPDSTLYCRRVYLRKKEG